MRAAWGKISAGEFLAPIDGIWVSGKPSAVIAGLSTDSRKIGPGELFLALRGERFDGHDFIEKAMERGAAGVVVQKDYVKAKGGRWADPVVIAVEDTLRALGDLAGWWRHQHTLRVVAITGSAGKTTTKEMAANILALGNRTLRNQGNLNNLIGLPLTLLQLDEGYRNAVLEMGMNRPGEIARLTEIADPDVGVITNVRMAHLEGLGDLEGVAQAKWELAEKISAGGMLVLNGDEKLLMKKRGLSKNQVITFGLETRNNVSAARIKMLGREGTSFHLHYQDNSWPVTLRVPGLQNVVNALAAAAVGLCLNEPPAHVVKGLGRFGGLKGRFEVADLPGGVVLVDDTYNANPSALRAALESLRSLGEKGGRIIVGLGEMTELGAATIPAHQEAGHLVAALRPHLFLAIGEHAREMTEAAVREGMPQDRVRVVATHDEMRAGIMEEMREGDLVFLKGSRAVGLEEVVEGLTSQKC